MNRLQMKFPDRHPNIPHTVKDVYEAARFILQSATTAPQNYFAPTPPDVNPPFVPDGTVSIAKREPAVKKEDLGTLFSEFTKTIVEAITAPVILPLPIHRHLIHPCAHATSVVVRTSSGSALK